MTYSLLLFAAFFSWFGLDFSLDRIQAPMVFEQTEEGNPEIVQILAQPFHFLGRGRQSFAFVSEDEKYVLKFFDRTYFELPWYAWIKPGEAQKREKRKSFYLHSYAIANAFCHEETAICYLHLGATQFLPEATILDRLGRKHVIPLNTIPFILQKKGELIYDSMQRIAALRGNAGIIDCIDQFLTLVSHRISLGIGDADHDVEHNFGFLGDSLFHLDPGRLFLSDFSSKENLEQEWWSATHNFRKWLVENYPDAVPIFDAKKEQKQKRKVQALDYSFPPLEQAYGRAAF